MRTKKLHIAFLDFDDLRNPLLSGGQARATYEVAYRLVKLGHKVTIICGRYPGSARFDRFRRDRPREAGEHRRLPC